MKKIFVSDFDGTLFQNGEVSQEDLEAIHDFRKQGGLFGIATGRMIGSIRNALEMFDVPVDFVVGMNGGVTVDKHYNEIVNFPIGNDIGKEVANLLRDNGAIHYSLSDGHNLCNQGNKSKNLRKYDRPCEEIFSNEVTGLHASMSTIEAARNACNLINEAYGEYVLALPNYAYIDVASNKVNKHIAIEMYLENHGAVEVATAGDAHNDLEMLKNYRGYAMRHGDEDIIHQIELHVDTVSEALEDFLKI